MDWAGNTLGPLPLAGVFDSDLGVGLPGMGDSKFSYEVLCCKLGLRLGREVIWRHDATHSLATDTPNRTFGIMAARQCPGLRSYVTIENSETFAMIRLGGQTLACHGTMSTACCTVDSSGNRRRYGLAHPSISASSSSAISTYSSTIRS
jgi:hypothetical protein